MKRMSVKAYVASGGSVCPFCGKDDIEWGDEDYEMDSLFKKAHCHSCKSQWQEQYNLCSYFATEGSYRMEFEFSGIRRRTRAKVHG